MINIFKKVRELEKENEELKKQLEYKVTPEQVMTNVLEEGLEWYDYTKLGFAEHISYYKDVQTLLGNDSFLNEYNKFLSEFIKEMAKDMNVEQIKYARFGVVAMEAFKDHLQTISSPEGNDSYDNLHENI